MAQHPSEPERKNRKKHSQSSTKSSKHRSSSKKPHKSQSIMDICTQSVAPQVQPAASQYFQSQQAYSQHVSSPPPPPSYAATPPKHPVYGHIPQVPPAYANLQGSPPPVKPAPYVSQTAIRFASPPRTKSRDKDDAGGPFKEQWNRSTLR